MKNCLTGCTECIQPPAPRYVSSISKERRPCALVIGHGPPMGPHECSVAEDERSSKSTGLPTKLVRFCGCERHNYVALANRPYRRCCHVARGGARFDLAARQRPIDRALRRMQMAGCVTTKGMVTNVAIFAGRPSAWSSRQCRLRTPRLLATKYALPTSAYKVVGGGEGPLGPASIQGEIDADPTARSLIVCNRSSELGFRSWADPARGMAKSAGNMRFPTLGRRGGAASARYPTAARMWLRSLRPSSMAEDGA